jgi:hypothetical protein
MNGRLQTGLQTLPEMGRHIWQSFILSDETRFCTRTKSRVLKPDSLRLQVDDLKQQISGFMSAKKSFREVTLEGEIAQLKGRAEDAAIWRVRLGEVERRLQDAEYREQKHVSFLLLHSPDRFRRGRLKGFPCGV